MVWGGGWKSLEGNFHCASSRVMVLEEGLEGVGEPNRGGCKQGCSFEKSLDVCANLEWKI